MITATKTTSFSLCEQTSTALLVFVLQMLAKPQSGGDTGAAAYNWTKNIHDDLRVFAGSSDMNEAWDLAQNRPLWRLMSLHSAMHS